MIHYITVKFDNEIECRLALLFVHGIIFHSDNGFYHISLQQANTLDNLKLDYEIIK